MINKKEIKIVFPESVKKYMRLQCNDEIRLYNHLIEIEKIEKYLKDLKPKIALDMGSGIGRASVFFFKYFNWTDTLFIEADGNSGEIQLSGIRNGEKEFYNSLKATELFCRANEIENLKLFNLEKHTWKELDCKPDLVYSFAALGFHWSFNQFLIDIYPFLESKCILIFGLRGKTQIKSWIDNQVKNINFDEYRIIEFFFDAKNKKGGFIILEKK